MVVYKKICKCKCIFIASLQIINCTVNHILPPYRPWNSFHSIIKFSIPLLYWKYWKSGLWPTGLLSKHWWSWIISHLISSLFLLDFSQVIIFYSSPFPCPSFLCMNHNLLFCLFYHHEWLKHYSEYADSSLLIYFTYLTLSFNKYQPPMGTVISWIFTQHLHDLTGSLSWHFQQL